MAVKTSTESIPLGLLNATPGLAGSDRIAVLDISTGKTVYATVDQIGTGGILDLNNAFTGNNTFAGTSGFNGAVSIGSSGTAGAINIFPATASKGSFAIDVTDQTGDTEVGFNINAMGQATVLNFADPGIAAAYVPASTAALTVAEMDILDGATITTAELNRLDDSNETETITAAGAISTVKTNTNMDSTAGTFAATLDVCPATMVGKIKTIRFAVDNGDVTLALTNVQGGTAATTATFADATDELILIGSAGGKWTVIKEFGVTLS
jgi:hypothetical protein